MSAVGVTPLTIVAIAIVTDVGMTGVISRSPRRLAELQLATAAGMVKEIAVGTMRANEVTAPRDGKNPGPGGRQVPQSSSALESRRAGLRSTPPKKAAALGLHPFMQRYCG